MTQDIFGLANQASKEWLKEYPTPEETANLVPKRYLEIFAKLVDAKATAIEREACAKVCDSFINRIEDNYADLCAAAIRARGQK